MATPFRDEGEIVSTNPTAATAHCDWDEIARNFGAGASANEAESVRAALDYLQRVLGPDLLQRVHARSGRQHPLFGLLQGSPLAFTPWARSGLVNWAKDLAAVEDCQNVGRVVSDLEWPTKCVHAHYLIEVGAKLKRAGMELAFEPAPPGPHNKERADALVEHPATRERFYLELSCQGLPNSERGAFDAMFVVQSNLWKASPYLRYAWRLNKLPAQAHLEEILERVAECLRVALDQGTLVEVLDGDEGDTLEMALCPSEKESELDRWCEERGISRAGVAGPQDRRQAARWLGDKICAKQRQLPPGHPNLLVIVNNFLFSRVGDINELLSKAEEVAYSYPNVAVIVVRGGYNSNRNEVPWAIQKGDHRFERQVRPWGVEDTLFLCNRYAGVTASAQLRARLLHALLVCEGDSE
jgi:hypothetical protein